MHVLRTVQETGLEESLDQDQTSGPGPTERNRGQSGFTGEADRCPGYKGGKVGAMAFAGLAQFCLPY